MLAHRIYMVLARISCSFLETLAHLFLSSSIASLHLDLQRLKINTNDLTIDNLDEYKSALVCAEDHRFFFHNGVDFVGVCRAIVQSFIFRCRQGGSTIEQQLVRTVTGDYRISIRRKIRELLLASTLHRILRKSEVLNCYLSIAYYGTELHGISLAICGIPVPKKFSHCYPSYVVAHLRYPRAKHKTDRYAERRDNRAHHIFLRLQSWEKSRWFYRSENRCSQLYRNHMG